MNDNEKIYNIIINFRDDLGFHLMDEPEISSQNSSIYWKIFEFVHSSLEEMIKMGDIEVSEGSLFMPDPRK